MDDIYLEDDDRYLPDQYSKPLKEHISKLTCIIDEMIPIITEFGNIFVCYYDDIEITIKKGKI